MEILTLKIPPGADLDEATLCATHAISRTPLREVLQRLAGEGYVSLVAHRGAKVATMDLTRMRTFFQTAPLIYSAVSRMAALQGSPPQLSSLKSIQAAFRQATVAGEPGRAALLNHEFHAKIGEMADNPYLAAALGRMLIDHTRLSQTFYRPANLSDRALVAEAADHHDEMIAAFASHDDGEAVAITLRHCDLSRDQLERFVRPDPLPIDLEGVRDAV